MRINDDFSIPVIVHAARQEWIASPAPGVDRRMLFRIGGEKATAFLGTAAPGNGPRRRGGRDRRRSLDQIRSASACWRLRVLTCSAARRLRPSRPLLRL